MLTVISPAKTQNFNATRPVKFSLPEQLEKTQILNKILKTKTVDELQNLMNISETLAQLNAERMRKFKTPFSPENAKPAIFAFRGDVYRGIDAETLDAGDLTFAQNHLRILSGFYGALRPLDLIQGYRLEMGIKLENPHGKNLYEFWGANISRQLNGGKNADGFLVNLASAEYFKAIDQKALRAKIIHIQFKEKRGGDYRIIGTLAKRARGVMARHIIKNRIDRPDELQSFRALDYRFQAKLSTADEWIFARG